LATVQAASKILDAGLASINCAFFSAALPRYDIPLRKAGKADWTWSEETDHELRQDFARIRKNVRLD